MVKYAFVSVSDIMEWIKAHPEKELGFTADTPEDIEINGEPVGWYGVKYTRVFGGNSLIFGDYGYGVIWCSDEMVEDAFLGFWERQFDELLDEDRLVCVDADDFGKGGASS